MMFGQLVTGACGKKSEFLKNINFRHKQESRGSLRFPGHEKWHKTIDAIFRLPIYRLPVESAVSTRGTLK